MIGRIKIEWRIETIQSTGLLKSARTPEETFYYLEVCGRLSANVDVKDTTKIKILSKLS